MSIIYCATAACCSNWPLKKGFRAMHRIQRVSECISGSPALVDVLLSSHSVPSWQTYPWTCVSSTRSISKCTNMGSSTGFHDWYVYWCSRFCLFRSWSCNDAATAAAGGTPLLPDDHLHLLMLVRYVDLTCACFFYCLAVA